MHKPLPELPRFQQLQYQFAAHIRNPEKNSAPAEIEDRRMGIYRELFFNNVQGFLASNFPVFKQVTPEDRWLALVRAFFDSHHCKTPYFLEIGQEFMQYINEERESSPDDYPFMAELLHYEWVELALDASEINLPLDDVNANGNLLQEHPVQSPLAWLLSYQYPVHCIRPDYLPDAAPDQATYLIAYRDREDDVKFMEVNAVTGRLLYLLSEDQQVSGEQALLQIAQEMQHPEPQQVVQGGLDTMEHLRSKGILLGTQL